MKLEFPYTDKGAATRLVVIFTGWSTDARYYADCRPEGWDVAVVSDYTDMSFPGIPEQYTTVYVFAYSLGVYAAARAGLKAAVKVAICGTPLPVSDLYGIPESIYLPTAGNLNEANLAKFHLRMAGDRRTYMNMRDRLPENPDIERLRRELEAIAEDARTHDATGYCFDRAYVATADRIFPADNQLRYWAKCDDTVVVATESGHATDIAAIIEECVPHRESIGKGFSCAGDTYRKNAIVQQEICRRIGEILHSRHEGRRSVGSLLEIGPGKGLLTEIWSRETDATEATYIDLCELQKFGCAANERYITGDAEEWLESTEEKFDLILSSSAIQWFADPVKFVATAARRLKPGGTAIISTFTKGNLRELDSVRPSPIIYHDADEYRQAGEMEIEQWERTLHFGSAREMMKHLHDTGVTPQPQDRTGARKPLKLSAMPKQLTYTPIILIIERK